MIPDDKKVQKKSEENSLSEKVQPEENSLPEEVQPEENSLPEEVQSEENSLPEEVQSEEISLPEEVQPEEISLSEKVQPEEISSNGSPYVREAENKLTEFFGAPVKIIAGKSRSQIQINFSDEEELSRIIENLDRTIPNSVGQSITTREEKIAALRKFSITGNRG